MRILILTGGDLDISFARSYIKKWKPDQVIAADAGLLHARELGITPDVILGDFDSCSRSVMDEFSTREKILVPCEKDDTDTGLAVEKAVELGASDVLILGATGTRLDHVLGNIGQVVYGRRCGVNVILADPCNRITMVESGQIVRKSETFGKYISLIPVYEAQGVTLEGFKYPLQDDTLVFHESWGSAMSWKLRREEYL
jgi:thiamine pyrophosphokinase